MSSLSISRRVDHLDPETIRDLVAEGKRKGLIIGGAVSSAARPAKIAKDGGKSATTAAPGGLESRWMDVTPALAADWLANNFRNRPISEDVVDSYARDMARGLWVATHQGVAFNDQDHLIDGQHRLHAVVKSRATIRMMVTFGLPSAIPGSEMTTMDAVDRGRTRSVADQLKIQHGLKQGSLIASLAVTLGTLCYNERTRRLSVGHTLEIYRHFQPAADWVIAHRPKEHGLKLAGVLAAFAFAITASDAPAAEAIRGHFRRLVTGEGLAPSMPITLLRAFLLSDDAKLLSRGNARGVSELVLETIRLQQAGAFYDGPLSPSLEGVTHYRSLQPERVAAVAELFRVRTEAAR
jgi:hypothetical protein